MKEISFAKHISWQILPNKEFGFVYNIRDHKYYEFQNTELIVWELISKKGKIEERILVELIADYYDMDVKDLEDDIYEYINSLFDIGVIEINGRSKY